MADLELPYNWDPRYYQVPVWNHMMPEREGLRAVCVWHRRGGKDLTCVNVAQTKMMQRVGTYWHMLPTYKQGRQIVWDGFTRDGRAFTDHFHPNLVAHKNNTEMKITLKNKSVFRVVGTDDINSLVGTNPVGVILSEYSLHNPQAWDYLRPILAENGGWALFIYTARGHNHGYSLLKTARKNVAMGRDKWFSEVLVAGDNGTKKPVGKDEDGKLIFKPVVSDEIIQEERDAGMEEAMIQQEFYCSFDASMHGAYYGTQMTQARKDGRVGRVPYDPLLPVNTYWDLGMDDSTTIWFLQRYRHELRLIDYYENSGEGLAHYAHILRERDYNYGLHVGPHDINVRELGSGKSRFETAKSLGITFKMVPTLAKDDAIEAVRNILPYCWFDETKCDRGVDALVSYRKEWDPVKKVFKKNPEHDWSSHAADAFSTLALHVKPGLQTKKKMQTQAVDNHQYL